MSDNKIEEVRVDAPEVNVAMTAVQVIAELSQMLYELDGHTPKSEALVLSTCAWLTSILDGKAANPAYAFIDAAKTVETSLLDEVSRCQHFLTQMVEKANLAESRAEMHELYAGWYLRLRDNPGDIAAGYVGHDGEVYAGEKLDAVMEDLDAEDPGNDIDTPTSPD
jgi:hypothetical protein